MTLDPDRLSFGYLLPTRDAVTLRRPQVLRIADEDAQRGLASAQRGRALALESGNTASVA
jgi:hypothetical protein